MYSTTEFSKYNDETDDNNSQKRMKNGNDNTTSTASNPGTATNDSIMAQTTQLASFGPFGDFFFSLCFFLLNNIYSYYGYNKATEGPREGSGDENGPKRHISRHLGHSVSFLFLIVFFIY